MPKYTYDKFIGTEFEVILDYLRKRRRMRSSNTNMTPEEFEQKYPKKKCSFRGCESTFSYAHNLIIHLNTHHPDYYKRITNAPASHQPIAGPSHQDIIRRTDQEPVETTDQKSIEATDQEPMETTDLDPMETSGIGIAETIFPFQQHYSQTLTYKSDNSMIPEPLDFEKSESDVDDDESDEDNDESDEYNVELGEINEFYESCLKPDPKHNSYLVSTMKLLEKDERDFLKQYIAELMEFRLKKSIPNAHAEGFGKIISRKFIEAERYPEYVREHMAKYSSSCYLQNKFLEIQNNYLKPTQISHPSGIDIQYFSVEGILRSIINQHPSLIDSIAREKSLDFQPESQRTNMLIKSDMDTTDERIFRRLQGKLRVEISLDDFSFVGKKGRKFVAGYMSCTNLPLKERTKRDNIYLFLMARRPFIRIEEEMNIMLTPFVNEMKQLEKTGIQFRRSINIEVTIGKVVCDNLSHNEILGFSMSFGRSSNCRECLIKRERYTEDRCHSILESDGINLENSVKNIVFRDCILTQLKGVTIANIAPPDIFHDLFEGCLKPITYLFLKEMISCKNKGLDLTSSIVIKRLQNFKFYNGDILVVYEKNKFKIYATGVQHFECFMRLPEIFFNESDLFCQNETSILTLYESAKSFCQTVLRTELTTSDLEDLEKLSKSILDRFVEMSQKYPSMKYEVTFKLHKLLHYGQNARRFGPLYLGSTLRYERCHQSSKKYGRLMGNWKAPTITLSERMALRQTLESLKHEVSPNLLIKETSISEYDAKSVYKLVQVKNCQGDFKIGKNILRRLRIRGYNTKIWIEASKFLTNVETGQMFVNGFIWTESRDEDGDIIKKLNLVLIKKSKQCRIINCDHLSHVNDYLFQSNGRFYVNRFI
ncbi:uncharacterized protein LOC113794060 [Dermatophagoides pteronyssinus]|uniref:uncharacterized protein LOC113794060 n=1 Tax=Dermatophagoides pteronyssinus TaxID=6956 RepID=UPI003F665B20